MYFERTNGSDSVKIIIILTEEIVLLGARVFHPSEFGDQHTKRVIATAHNIWSAGFPVGIAEGLSVRPPCEHICLGQIRAADPVRCIAVIWYGIEKL